MATFLLVKEAILALKDRTGSSVIAINRWIESEKKTTVKKHVLKAALKRGVETGSLVQVKNSFKVSAAEKAKKLPSVSSMAAKSKSTAKKPAAKKATKKSSTKSKSTAAKKKTSTKKTTVVKKKTASKAKKPTTKPKGVKAKTSTKKRTSLKKKQ